jgi:hypothetical protein
MANILGTLLVELGVNTAAFKGGLDKATYQAKQWSGELKNSLRELGSSFSELGNSLGASFGPAGQVVNGLTRGMGALLTSVKAAGGGAGAIGALGIATAGLAGAAAAAAAGYASLAVGGAHYVEELTRMSEKTGISIRDLQTLKAAGESVDVPLESMTRGFRTLSRALVEGSEGSSRASKTLHNLGVTAHEPYEAMLQIADGIQKVKDPMLRAADATALFGARIGLSLLPLLEKGREGIEEWKDIVDVFGQRVDTQAKMKTDEWKESTVKLSTAWDGLKVAATGFLPVVTAVTNEMAVWVRAASHFEGVANSLKDTWSLITSEKLSSTVSDQINAQEKAAKDYDKQLSDNANNEANRKAKIREGEEHAFNLLKEGGAAGAALKETELKISQAIADEDFKDAAELQKKIPALKLAAEEEKKRAEAILNMPKETKKAIDAQEVTVTKAYAEAIKSLGPAYADESRQLENAAAMETFINKQREVGTYGTKEAITAANAYRASLEATSAAKEALSKGGEFGKVLSEELIKLDEEANKSDRLTEATTKIGKAQAELAGQMDNVNRKRDEAVAAYNLLMNSDTATTEQKKLATEALAREIDEYQKLAPAIKKAMDAKAADITADAFKAEAKEIEQKERYLELLKIEPADKAKVQAAAEAEGKAIGLEGTALKNYIDLKMKANELDKEGAAAGLLEKGTPAGQKDAAKLVSDLMAQKGAFLAAGGSVDYYDAQLLKAEKDLWDMQAAGGRVTAGLKAGFADFAAETKTLGSSIQHNITTALNGVSQGLAKTIVEGKSFGAAMRKVAQEVAESFIEMEIKRLLMHLMTELHITAATIAGNATREADDKATAKMSILADAKSAAVKGWNAGMKFPFPLDFVMAPALAGAAFAGAIAFDSFDQGGIVRETGLAQVHENEMVLPRPLSEKVQQMTETGVGGRMGGVTVHYSPSVHAVDGKGIGDMLNQHGHLFTQHVVKELRRRNMA